MSNIPEARLILAAVIPCITDPTIRRQLNKALSLMKREKYVRHARHAGQQITDDQMYHAMRLSRNLNLTIHQIANKTGLRNSGRVSEILTGKRKPSDHQTND